MFVYLLVGAMILPGQAGPRAGAQAATEPAAGQRQALEKRAFALNQKAVELSRQGHSAEAIRVMREALRIREQLYPEDRYPDGNPGLAQSMYNLGSLLDSAGEHQKGLSLCKRALAMCEKLYPRDRYPQGHEQLAHYVADLGRILQKQGQFRSALPLSERGVALYEALYPRDKYPRGHPSLATSLADLGKLYRRLGEYQKALSALERALAMHEKLYPRDEYPQGHPNLAKNLNDLGFLLLDLKQFHKAVSVLERAVAMDEALYPRDKFPAGHPDLAVSRNNLAGALNRKALELSRQGHTAEAIRVMRESLRIREQLYPEDRYPDGNPGLAQSMYNLGSLLVKAGEHQKGLSLCKRALAMCEKLYPRDRYPQGHPQLADYVAGLGRILAKQEQFHSALPLLERGVALYEALYPQDKYPRGHPDLASSLMDVGILYHRLGEYQKAISALERALAMHERLYPRDEYPQEHPDLAKNLKYLGALLRDLKQFHKAVPVHERIVAMYEALYPRDRFPAGHPDLALSLNNLAVLLGEWGQFHKAVPRYARAVAMYEALYPRDRFPAGHPRFAQCLFSYGTTLASQGELQKARPLLHRALAMCRALYPKEKYPNGHGDLVTCMMNLGGLLQAQGEFSEARPYFEEALAMAQALYPGDKLSPGHIAVANCMHNLAGLLMDQGKYQEALPLLEEALALRRRLYPPDQFPSGHPDLVSSLHVLGSLLRHLGEYEKALPRFEQALDMCAKLYPRDVFPGGHPLLAKVLAYQGYLFRDRGEYQKALPLYERALAMQQDLFEEFAGAVSEAEALNYLASLPRIRDEFLSLPPDRLQATPDVLYAPVWRGKAAVLRLLEFYRQKLLAARDPESRALWDELQDTRRQLARLLFGGAGPGGDRHARLQQLGARKEELQRRLAEKLSTRAVRPHPPHTELLERLPSRTVFIDLLRYVRSEPGAGAPGRAGRRYTPAYVAFVLRPGGPVRRVDLGPAGPIDEAVSGWRKAIAEGRPGTAARTLGRLVWQPLAEHVPADTRAVYLAPDGALARLPWAALPGRGGAGVLLEQHALAVVPHGPFLLERLRNAGKPDPHAGLLALGGVSYDNALAPAAPRPGWLAARAPAVGAQGVKWADLPRTLQEVDRVTGLAGDRPVRRLTGARAGTAQLVAELPRARWAHLATHGFFADAGLRSALRIDEDLFRHGRYHDRGPVGARNPLVLSGLVLAGANRPAPEGVDPAAHDGGILTAEAVVGLPLDGLELAVLSACETGLGEVAGGEGVFGLQRAFHLAGTRDVIASLWKVDDEATTALMTLFYHKLWREHKEPLVALREAQLTLYHHPDRIGPLAVERGLRLDQVVVLPQGPRDSKAPSPSRQGAVKLWAGFVLSGPGR